MIQQGVWTKSQRSSNDGSCVEVMNTGHEVLVRNSRNRDGSFLVFTSAEWEAFLDGAKKEEFDI